MLTQKVLAALRAVLHCQDAPVALHEPHFGGKEWAYVKECLDTRWVSSAGKFVDKFELMLAEYTGAKRAVAVVNGTAALHAALRLLDVKPGDEVLVPALTFVATANAVCYCGAVPHFVDSEERTLGMAPGKLETYLEEISDISAEGCYNRTTGRRIKAIVPMHTFGHPADLDALVQLSARFELEMVEDAAEALGSLYKGRHVGNWGKLAILSFNGNKPVTTGGGGAILTNDEDLGNLAKHITTTAKKPHSWEYYHDQIGYNYRLPNINAALGCAQIEQLPAFLKLKRMLAKRYQDVFEVVEGVTCFKEPGFAQSNYWLNALLLDEDKADLRDSILQHANENGIGCRPAWTLMHELPMFRECPKMDLSNAENIKRRLINIPSSPFLGDLNEKT